MLTHRPANSRFGPRRHLPNLGGKSDWYGKITHRMGQEIVVMVGLQGAGKSTYCQRYFSVRYTYISKDRLRNNRRPQRRQMQLVEEALKRGESVVVDNTHPSPVERSPLIQLAQRWQIPIRAVFLDTPAEICEQRNQLRPEGKKVPQVGLYATRKIFQVPSLEEGFTEVLIVRG
jgi:predicted kinase